MPAVVVVDLQRRLPPVQHNEYHGTLKILWCLELDVDADCIGKATYEQPNLLLRGEVAGVGHLG